MNNVILCGFMGCGKTTVGRSLALQLGRPFIDMDAYIEEHAGMCVSSIFETFGEARFRELETQAAQELSAMREIVVSTGGGAVLNPRNVELFRAGGILVYIEVPLEVIRLRLSGDTTRPLLNRPDRDAAMKALFEKRAPLYAAAAGLIVQNADNRPAQLIAQEIAQSAVL